MASGTQAALQNSGSGTSDVLIVGAGIMGLSLALELRRQGASVTILEQKAPFAGASSAAAGMLAAEDPYNPPELLPFSRFSLSLYPGYLEHIAALSGQHVPFQTSRTIQHTAAGCYELAEHSIDPRQLGPALLAAAQSTSVRIVEHVPLLSIKITPTAVGAHTPGGTRYRAAQLVHTTGAWIRSHLPALPIAPRKGQMLRVAMPTVAMPLDEPLRAVHRAEHIYVVPRTSGPQAGTALIGATVEDAGFNLDTDPSQLEQLREQAAALAPETVFAANAPLVEAWAGLRPHTPDLLPVLGRLQEREWIAAGHFRNGILLAPATATAVGSMLSGHPPGIDLTAFTPTRFDAYR